MIQETRLLFLLLTLLALFPAFFQSEFLISLVISACIWSIFVTSYNLLLGHAGQASFAHAAFYGIGAYTSALLTIRLGLPIPLAMFVAAVTSAAFSYPIAWISLRLRSYYFFLVTLAFGEVVRIIALNWIELTNGYLGITGIPAFRLHVPYFSATPIVSHYYLTLFILGFSTLILYRILNSRKGRMLVAVREDEVLAEHVGINSFREKLSAFVISAFFTGLAGSLYAHLYRYIDTQLFSIEISIVILTMVFVGGRKTFLGPIIGAILLTFLVESLRVLAQYRLIAMGAALVVVIALMPEGLWGNLRKSSLIQRVWHAS